jgi:superfamily II DNA or RNA helicase
MKTARDYQTDAIGCIKSAFASVKSTLLVMATGLGKSVCISKVANEWDAGNVLLLAHRIELVDQLADHMAGELGYRPPIEQGNRGIDPSDVFKSGVLVGSIQSMITERRLRKFQDHPIGLIVVDEAHRATSPSYVKLVDRYRDINPELKVLGVTATPNRTDETALGLVFDSVAYEMGILEGIDEGWLVDIHQKFAMVEELDLSKIPCKRNEFGEMDFSPSALEELLSQEGPLHAMSRPVLDSTTQGQQAIIFAASVQHAHLWAAVLNHYRSGCAAAIDGTMRKGMDSPRDHIVKGYKRGDIQFLLNYNIATEGFDAPSTSMVVMGRPTKSKLVYTQMLGRCTRTMPGTVDGVDSAEERKDKIRYSCKPFATVLDFTGNSTRHDCVTATDILGGNYEVDVRKVADELIGPQENGVNVRDALTKAQACMLLEAEEKKRRPIRKAIAQTPVAYTLQDVDPFGGVKVRTAPKTSRGGSTDAQINALVNFGVRRDVAVGYGRQQASAVLDSIREKRCSVKQAKILVRYGHDPRAYNCAEAKAIIDQIAARGWRK